MPKRCSRRANKKRNRRRKRLTRWSFIGYRESVFGKHSPVSHKEMWRLYRIGVVSDNSPVMAENDVKFHKIAEWKTLLHGLLPFSFSFKSYEQAESIMHCQTDIIDSKFLSFLPKVGPQVPIIPAEAMAVWDDQPEFDGQKLPYWAGFSDDNFCNSPPNADSDVWERLSRQRRSYRTYSAHFDGSLACVDEETAEEVEESLNDSFDELNETLAVEIGAGDFAWNLSSSESPASPVNRFFNAEFNERCVVSRGTDSMDPTEYSETKAVNTEPMVVPRRRRYASSSSDGGLFSEDSLDSPESSYSS